MRNEPMMRTRFCFAATAAVFSLLASNAFAQGRNGNGDDQPGYEPTQQDEQVDPKFQKTVVFFRSTEQPGTIIVSTSERFLYVVQPGGRALRYGIGVGRDGFQWQGLVKINREGERAGWAPAPDKHPR